MRRSLFLLVLSLALPLRAAETVVSFDALLPGPGLNLHTAAVSVAAVAFNNFHDPVWDSWAGFAFSTVSNETDGTWLNQYAAARALPRAYAVAYHDSWNPPPQISFAIPAAPRSVLVNLTTYAAATLRNGDAYGWCQPFSEGDFFVLTLTAYDAAGREIAALDRPLADFRAGQTFIQTNWTRLDLTAFGDAVASIAGTVAASDPAAPTYFALADLTYAYAGGARGLAATNPAIVCWADGWTNYAPGPNVEAKWQTPANALGPAEFRDDGLGSTNGVVSLGDAGHIVLTFPVPIADGPGPDFVIFENAFSADFLELGLVEVSSDGEDFVRFPCHVLATNPVDAYASAGPLEPDAYGGLAGKHTQGFGTPFDLRELAGAPGLDLRRVTHVKLVDIPGDGSVRDDYGNPIYDPTPTTGSGGFDLDAVGVLNPNLDISPDPAVAAPNLAGFQTVLEYKARLDAPDWTTNAPPRGAPGFFRWRLVR